MVNSEQEIDENEIIRIEAKILEQEHRFITSVINFVNRTQWPRGDARRKATVVALLWKLVPRITPVTAGVGLLGLLTILLAYEANLKLENQNTLITVQNELSEAQRRSSLNIELSEIMNEVNNELADQEICSGDKPSGFKKGHKLGCYKLGRVTESRIVAISNSLKPYRSLVDTSKVVSDSSVAELKNIFSFSSKKFFTNSYDIDDFLELQYLSPERAQLVIALSKLRIKIDGTGGLGQLCNLNYSDLRRTNLRKADLRDAQLDHSNFNNARLDYVVFDGASMEEGRFENAAGTSARFENSDLFRSLFDNANLPQVSFKGAFLVDATFVGADLIHADMSGANVSGSNFTDANLQGANLEGLQNYEDIASINGALIADVVAPPVGFVEWALSKGAQLDSDAYIRAKKEKDPERYYRVFSAEQK